MMKSQFRTINLLSKQMFFLSTFALMAIVSSCNHKTDTFDWTLHKPEEVGMTNDGLEKIRAAVQKNIDDKLIAGCVSAIVKDNKLVWYEAQGYSNPIEGKLMQKDNLFHMMSSSKVVTAVAVLRLMDEGKLSIHDNVNKYIPSFTNQKVGILPEGSTDPSDIQLVPAERDITIKDLLTHTSGLNSLGGVGFMINKIEKGKTDSLAQYIPRLGSAVLDFQPGTKWSYSPLDGIDVLLRIVEIVSGKSGDVYLKENIFNPLDMNNTYFLVPEEKRNLVLNAFGYRDGEWHKENLPLGYGSDTYIMGAAGLFSTAHDFLNFEVMLFNKGTFNGKQILKPETVELMSQDQIGSINTDVLQFIAPGSTFGLGVGVVVDEEKAGGRSVGAFGWGGAYGTETWVDPELNIAAVMLIQALPPEAVIRANFQKAVRSAILEKQSK